MANYKILGLVCLYNMDVNFHRRYEINRGIVNPPMNMQAQINRYISEAQALAKEPTKLLTPANPHLIYLLHNSETLLESLNQIVSLYQQEDEAKIQSLKWLETLSGVIILLTLAFLGLYIFRPLAKTLLKERVQLEQTNQELGFLSSVDGLTLIANRRQFDQFLTQTWSLAVRNAETIALIMCDIDFPAGVGKTSTWV